MVVCTDTLPDASVGVGYDVDITFRVNEYLTYRSGDSILGFTVDMLELFLPPGTFPLTIDVLSGQIMSVTGLPPGLEWTCDSSANNCFYEIPQGAVSCLKICGTPECVATDQTYTIAIEVEVTEDLINLLNAFSGGGGFPFPFPIPSTQVTSEIFYFEIFLPAASSLVLDITASITDTVQPGTTVTLSGTAGFLTYEWSDGSTTSSISPAPTETTTYTCSVTDIAGCEQVASYTVFVEEESNSIGELSEPQFRIFPNPAKDVLQICFNNPEEHHVLVFYNLQGLEINSYSVVKGTKQVSISLHNFTPGVYLVRQQNKPETKTSLLFIH